MADKASKENGQEKDYSYLFTPEMDNGRWVAAKKRQLEGKKKGIFGGENSTKFTQITQSLGLINDALNVPMTDDDNEMKIQMAYRGFLTLIEACNNYIYDENGETRSTKTITGSQRIRIVKEIKAYAEKDINLVLAQSYQPEELKGATLGEAIGKARMRTITLQKADKDHEHVGGASSYLTVLDAAENGGEVGYYSDMKVWKKGKTEKDILPFIKRSVENADVSLAVKKNVWDALVDSGYKTIGGVRTFCDKFEKNSEETKTLISRILSTVSGIETSLKSNIYDRGQVNVQSDTANLNARNVGMSRVAKLLGRENLIAKSEMVELREEGKENRYGSVMKKAEGVEMNEYLTSEMLRYSENRDEFISKQEFKDKVKESILPSFQRDLADLQVIDYLCGQTDRHTENYYVVTGEGENEGKFMGLTGIDNDLSFGDALNRQNEEKKYNFFGNWGRLVADANEDIYIPHMSRSLAITISFLDENMVKYVLSDLIGKADIEAFCNRLRILKKVCINELKKEPDKSRLVDDDGWNDETLEDFMSADSQYIDGPKDGSSNYIGSLVQDLSIIKYSSTKNKFLEMKKAKK